MGYFVCWVLGTFLGMFLMCAIIVGDDSRR